MRIEDDSGVAVRQFVALPTHCRSRLPIPSCVSHGSNYVRFVFFDQTLCFQRPDAVGDGVDSSHPKPIDSRFLLTHRELLMLGGLFFTGQLLQKEIKQETSQSIWQKRSEVAPAD
jgi:hypothetical protein